MGTRASAGGPVRRPTQSAVNSRGGTVAQAAEVVPQCAPTRPRLVFFHSRVERPLPSRRGLHCPGAPAPPEPRNVRAPPGRRGRASGPGRALRDRRGSDAHRRRRPARPRPPLASPRLPRDRGPAETLAPVASVRRACPGRTCPFRRWRPSSCGSSRRATAGSTSRSGTASAACSRTTAASWRSGAGTRGRCSATSRSCGRSATGSRPTRRSTARS